MATKILAERYGVSGRPIYEILCDTEACREGLDVSAIEAGSTSFVAESGKTYILNNQKTWCEM